MAAQMGVSLIPVTIAAGQSLSPQVDLGAMTLVGLYVPASWTAANPSFQVSPDGGATWFEHNASSGSATAFGNNAGVATYLAVDPAFWRGVYSLKVRSGPLGAPIVQTGSVTLTLVLKFVS
jgi:hypothetical protein